MDSISSTFSAWGKILISNFSAVSSKFQLNEYVHSVTKVLSTWGNVFSSDKSSALPELQITNYVRIFMVMTVLQEIFGWFAMLALRAQEQTMEKEQAERRKMEDEESDDERMQYLEDDED